MKRNNHTFEIMRTVNQLYPHIILYQVVTALLNVLNQILVISFLGIIINLLSKTRANTINKLFLFTIIFLLLLFIIKLLQAFIEQQAEKGRQMLNVNADADMTEKLTEVSYSTFISAKFRKLYSATKNGLDFTGGFEIFVSRLVNSVAQLVLTLVIAGGLLINALIIVPNGSTYYVSNFILCALILIPIAAAILCSKQSNKVMLKFFDFNIQFNRALDYFSNILFGNVNYTKLLRIYDPDDLVAKQAAADINQQVNQDTKYQLKADGIGNLSDIITSLIIGLMYCILSIRVLNGKLLLGTMIACVGYLEVIINNLSAMLYAWNSRNASLATVQQYIDLMQTEGDTELNLGKTKKTATASTTEELTIEFKHVYFKYPEDQEYILKDLNFKIFKGEKIAIVGPNGSGKTTMIKLLLRLYEPNKGEILVNGQDIRQLDLTNYQRIFGTVFQDFTLFAWSIKDNILMGAPLDKAKMKLVLSQVELSDRIRQLPQGLETSISQELDESGVEFSGGEKQKIAIARALYRDAPIVVLDEPTAALDPVAEANIFSKFNELTAGKTAIFISHRMSSTQFSDRILVLKEGKIIERGTHDELMNQKGLYQQLYHEQAKYFQAD